MGSGAERSNIRRRPATLPEFCICQLLFFTLRYFINYRDEIVVENVKMLLLFSKMCMSVSTLTYRERIAILCIVRCEIVGEPSVYGLVYYL